MPPFVYHSLRDFMRASATAKTRQELLQRIIANAAKRKSQLHVDATGARIATSPETFGMNMGKQIMNKQANPLTSLLARLRPSAGRLFDATFGIPGVPQKVMDVSRPVLSAAEEAAERFAGVPRQVPMPDLQKKLFGAKAVSAPSVAEMQQKALETAERFAGIPRQVPMSKKSIDKQANPLTQMISPALKNLRSKVVPELLQRLQILAGKGARGVKRYGQRLMGDDTLKPLYARQDEMRALEKQLREQAGSRIDTTPLQRKSKMWQELQSALVGKPRYLPDRPYMPGDVFDATAREGLRSGAIDRRKTYEAVLEELLKSRPAAATPGGRVVDRGGSAIGRITKPGPAEMRDYRAAARDSVQRVSNQARVYDNIFDEIRSRSRGIDAQINTGTAHNAMHDDIWQKQLPNVFRSQVRADKAIRRELDAIRKTRDYTAVGAPATVVGGGSIYGAYKKQELENNQMLAKKSMTMPQPTSRGTMKKVQLPEASPSKPDCDPEGVQMSTQDHESVKQALVDGALIGAGLGAASAPEGHILQNAGRGAVRGVGTELGAVLGAGGGGAVGHIGGSAVGALLAMLARKHVDAKLLMPALKEVGRTFGTLGGMGIGAYQGGRMGYNAAGKLMGPASYKQAGLGSILKTLAKGVYKTPRSLKGLVVGGAGGYYAGRQHGHQLGLEDGREDAAKSVIDLFQKKQSSTVKQAFLTGATVGALGGLATSKPGQRASGIGRGALIGGGTELGAVGGAGFGGLTGTALGAILGGLISRKPEGAMAGAGLGGLSGAVLGAGGGGYAGHIGTKALLDGQQNKDVNPKKRKKEENDDKEVKQAAEVVLAQLMKNRAQ